MEYLYEYNGGSLRAIRSRDDWFFPLDVLETVYDGEVLHRRVPRPDLTDIFTLALLHPGQFHEIG